MSITQLEKVIKVGEHISFHGVSQKEKYEWIGKTLSKFRYFSLQKKEKSIVKQFMIQMTGYSDAQMTNLIAQKRKVGIIIPSSRRRHSFPRKYTPEDVARLIDTDNAHSRLSGKATKRIFDREYNIFGKKEYERLKDISVSHIYNLRGKRQYLSNTLFWQKTKPTPVNIGQRAKPEPFGNPGYIRVDTVHQGDLNKEKGVYHLNFVDEVTQWELVACVERISETYLIPVLEKILQPFPFQVINFHSDNGGEYINKIVAALLNKLLIRQTKSRARRCNDNALVEGKNGSVVRKHMGRNFISRRYAKVINGFYEAYFNVYLNFHRPCGFATIKINARGKEKKVYNTYQTPYEAMRAHVRASDFLKEGVSFEKLDKIAHQKSDNEFAALMQKAKVELFKSFRHSLKLPTSFAVPISG